MSQWVEALETRRVLAAVTALVLADADTGQVVGTLEDGATLNLTALPTHLSVRAQATDDTVRVRFGLDAKKNYRTTGSPPFSMAWALQPGLHTLTATAYPRRGRGDLPAVVTCDAVVSDVAGPLSDAVGGAADPAPPPALPGDWHVALDQEFTALPDPGVWTDRFWWDGNTMGEDALAAFDPGAVSASDGMLSMTARPAQVQSTDGAARPYVSGLLTTGGVRGGQKAGFTFRYGYAEARIRVPAGRSLWPAFWMLPASYHDGAGEIDVMETRGSAPAVQEMHYHHGPSVWGGSWAAPDDLSAGFHTYGVDWEPGYIAWYVDGVKRFRFSTAGKVVKEPMYLILDLAVGGSWDGPPDATTPFPATMQVDWVRVWQKR